MCLFIGLLRIALGLLILFCSCRLSSSRIVLTSICLTRAPRLRMCPVPGILVIDNFMARDLSLIFTLLLSPRFYLSIYSC